MSIDPATTILTTADAGIRLRPVSLPDDIPAAVAWYRDPDVLHLSQGDGEMPWDAAMVEKMYAAMGTRCAVYIIEVHEHDGWRPIGDASLCREAGTPIVIGAARDRSRGIGGAVLARLVDRARELGWAEVIVSGIYTDNHRALRLYAGAGFTVVGAYPAANDRHMVKMVLTFAR